MKIDLDKIPPQGLELKEVYNATDLDLEDSEVKYINPLEINAQISKYGNTVNVDTQVKTVVSIRCSRCLQEFKRAINNNYNFAHSSKNGIQSVDITEDIRQELILEYSIKNLCRVDCQGLCLSCGKNLNEGQCNCQIKT